MRRLLRRLVLWILRPFATPVVFRFRLWMRASVDESASATRIGEIDRNVQAITHELASLRSLISAMDPAASLRDLHNISCASKLVIDETKASTTSAIAQSVTVMDLLSKRLVVFQLSLDALRIDHRRDGDRHIASIDTVRRHLQDMTVYLDDLKRTSDITLSRADVSLKRVAIPLGSELIMRTDEGFLLVPPEDGALVASVWESGGRLEPGTLIILKAILQAGDCVIDVGANIGLVSVPVARCVGPAGHVIAIEPSSRIANLLRRSFELNGMSDRVTLHQCAVGDKAGKALLNLGLPVGHSSLLPLPGSEDSEEVDVKPLDDLVQRGSSIRCVKIDAEGFEPQVWRGMQRIIAENPDLVVLVEFGPEHLVRANISIDDWMDEFLAPGFVAYEISEVDGMLSPLRARIALQQVITMNLLFIRQPAAVFSMLSFK